MHEYASVDMCVHVHVYMYIQIHYVYLHWHVGKLCMQAGGKYQARSGLHGVPAVFLGAGLWRDLGSCRVQAASKDRNNLHLHV